jgi:hypothetical protein
MFHLVSRKTTPQRPSCSRLLVMKSYLVTKFGSSLVSAERAAKARPHAHTSWTVRSFRFAPHARLGESHFRDLGRAARSGGLEGLGGERERSWER